ncbi:uncharacterized protein LOC133302960 [Gastrolobium bilobum]|uniref:uncharacterized protein LOC133302960 n=1 Tax=Gastrolobium bilobum TaxID=150636 RepID=UPI002AB01F15|nr:uncharacterized protein LOC133302960 [Gastrolobium bilobum]
MALLSKNKLGFVDGSIQPPPIEDHSFSAWQRCNTIVLAWIHRSINDSIAKSILWIDKAQDAWIDLRDRFQQSDIFRVLDLQEDIYKMQQGERLVSDFFTDVKIMWDELDNLKPLPSCKCDNRCLCGGYQQMRQYRETDHVIRFLKGLNEQYSHVRSQIMLLDPLPNINRVFSMIVQQERQMLMEGQPDMTIESRTFFNNSDKGRGRGNFTQGGRGRGNSTQGGRDRGTYGQGRGSGRLCTFCGKQNHIVDTCYRKHGFPPGFKFKNATNCISLNAGVENLTPDSKDFKDKGISMSHEQYEALLNALSSSKINADTKFLRQILFRHLL